MRSFLRLFILFEFLSSFGFAQNWTVELKSFVEYRTWSLTTKDVSKEIQLVGATIKLFQNGKLVSQVTSAADGEFTLMVPANGEFIGEVSYPGCNTKRFSVSTTGVPEKVGTDDYKPTFTLHGGFVMVKPYPGIDYSALQNSLIHVAYLPSLKNFDDVASAKEAGLDMVGKIYADEDVLFKAFCAKNRAGDAALKIPDCPLARKLYNEAIAIIPNEEYPVEQLKKVGACLKEAEEAEKKAKEEAAAKEKARLDQLEKDKIDAARISKENEDKEKANKEKLAKNASDKEAADKAAKEKAEADKIAKENAAKEKEDAKKTDKEKAEAEKLARKKADEDDAAKKKKQAEEDDVAKKKKKADDDEIARKKKKADDDEEANKRKYKDPKEPILKGEQDGKKDVIVGGKVESTPKDGDMDAEGVYHHPVRRLLGVDQYKEHITKGNDYFKHKRYEEAKASFEAALKEKPDDPVATKKIADCEKILSTKK